MERDLINCGTCRNSPVPDVCQTCVDMLKWARKEYSRECLDCTKLCSGCALSGVEEIPMDIISIKGVSKDTEIVEAELGCKGKQSPTFYRFDLIDAKVLFNLAETLKTGADKYGENNWREIPEKNHVNRAMIHLWAYLDGDTQDDHLGHAFCRIMMALAKKLEK